MALTLDNFTLPSVKEAIEASDLKTHRRVFVTKEGYVTILDVKGILPSEQEKDCYCMSWVFAADIVIESNLMFAALRRAKIPFDKGEPRKDYDDFWAVVKRQ